MKVQIIGEYGYEQAIEGLSLSYGQTDWTRIQAVADRLAVKDGGHNKFLESIYVWIDVTAPRFWWQEADTYRLSTKQSESSIHRIMSRLLTQDDFEYPIPPNTLETINNHITSKDFVAVKNMLCEGFLQRRIWAMNYKVLRNIILQRRNHKLKQWRQFIETVLSEVRHPALLPTLDEDVR